MKRNLSELSTPELRSLFVKESKKFSNTLDFPGDHSQEKVKDRMLTELRDYLKEIRELIEWKERQEAGK